MSVACALLLALTAACDGTGTAREPEAAPPEAVTPEAGSAARAEAMEPNMTDLKLPDCATFRREAPDEEAAVERFLALYPEALVSETAVESTPLTPGELTATVAFASCASGLAGPGPEVADATLALFTSRRHGAAARAALDRLAAAGGEDGRAAAAFAEQIRAFRDGPDG